MNMIFSKHGAELLKELEGCILHIYHDSAGKPTIGIGHLLLKEELIGEIIGLLQSPAQRVISALQNQFANIEEVA